MSMRTLAVAAGLCLVVLQPASGTEAETGGVAILLHADEAPDALEDMVQQLSEHVTTHQAIELVHVADLADHWPDTRVAIEPAGDEVCTVKGVPADQFDDDCEAALQLAVGGRLAAASNKAARARATWPCIVGPVTARSLQLTSLVQAWHALVTGDGDAFDRHLRQSAAIHARLPADALEFLPDALIETFQQVVGEQVDAATGEVLVSAEGLPVDVYVDGRVVGAQIGTGGDPMATLEVSQGEHIVQIGPSGEEVQSYVVTVTDGLVAVHATTSVESELVAWLHERVMVGGDLDPLLAGILSQHARTRHTDQVVICGTREYYGERRYVQVPYLRSGPGQYQLDEDLLGSLQRALDRRSDQVSRRTFEGDDRAARDLPGKWWLRVGGGGGLAVVDGYGYFAPFVELGIETPVWLGLEIRPELALTRETVTYETTLGDGVDQHSTTYATMGGGVFATFTPQYKRLRFLVGFGATTRQPDHRFERFRALPTVEAGIGLRLGESAFLGLSAELTLHQVYDSAIRIAFVKGIELRRRGPKAGEADDELALQTHRGQEGD